MKFSVVSLLAAASSAVAQLPPTAGFDAIVVPTAGQTLTPGGSLDITWQPNGVKGTITIHLLQGAASNLLEDGGVVAGMCAADLLLLLLLLLLSQSRTPLSHK